MLMNTLINLSNEIAAMRKDIASIKLTQDNIVKFLVDKKVTQINNVVIDFKTKFNFNIPITSLEQFLLFDSELAKSDLLKNDVV